MHMQGDILFKIPEPCLARFLILKDFAVALIPYILSSNDEYFSEKSAVEHFFSLRNQPYCGAMNLSLDTNNWLILSKKTKLI